MGGATAIGLSKAIADGRLQASVTVTARHEETLFRFKGHGIETTTDNVAAAAMADMVIIAVKPWFVPSVVEEIRTSLTGKTLVSFAAGVKPENLMRLLEGSGVDGIYIAIPNLAAEVCQSMTFVQKISGSSKSRQDVKSVFASIGKGRFVDGKQLNAGMALSSCGIAYAMRYIRASVEGGVELGLSAKDALEIELQTVLGAAELLKARGTHPEQEIDRVATPGGFTIRGLNAMEEAGFTAAVIKGLKS